MRKIYVYNEKGLVLAEHDENQQDQIDIENYPNAKGISVLHDKEINVKVSFDKNTGIETSEKFVKNYKVKLEESRVSAIKGVASDLIKEIAPEWKQLNMIADALSIVNKKLNKETLTTEEKSKEKEFKEIWEKVKLIRKKSDELEKDKKVTLKTLKDESKWKNNSIKAADIV